MITVASLFHPEFKHCIICGKRFFRPKGKSDKVWNAQRACGKNCSNYLRRKATTQQKSVNRRKNTEMGKNCRFGE